jgi:alpha-amylase/alpha-mannosidase (GH57 family)
MKNASLNLAFIWHMHQPDYRDGSGVMAMPWVFLHAIKDYYEMPWLLSLRPGLKATFNVTPPLIEQLLLYAEPLKNDAFLAEWIKPPASLSVEERRRMIKMCRSTQFDTMVRPLPRYAELYHLESYDDAQLLEMEVLFILAWCGNYLRRNNDVVRTMLQRGEGFTQEDKTELLDALTAFVATILPFYADLQRKGVISLSTTPYNHPILPLLIDVRNAKKANEHTTLPANPLSLEADAVEQVRRAVELYKKTFHATPTGFWPAEGAVDERSVEIYRQNGLKWIATDEAILFRSLGNADRHNLYRPYRFDGVTMGFRDHGLSDLIGFTYRFKNADEAADHFMRSVGGIASPKEERTVFVILDGENAWEFFDNNAYDFFTALYAKLASSAVCSTVTMDEVASQQNQSELQRLAPGSWIHGNFDTWSGHHEKNRAWELIYQTRRDVDNFTGRKSPEAEETIRHHFLAAECSDWFWWYGDDHVTDFAEEFDALFRDHLITIYRTLNMQPPSNLFEPIISHKKADAFLTFPQSSIAPEIDGRESSFFEWLGCGTVDETKVFSTMDRVRGPVEKILYGHDDEQVYLAFEGKIDALRGVLMVTIEESGRQLTFPLQGANREKDTVFALDERLELSLSRRLFDGFDAVHLRFEIADGEAIVQTLPGFGSLLINMAEVYAEHWFV